MGPDFTYYLNSSRPLKNFLYFLKKHSSYLGQFPASGPRIKKTQPEKISYIFPEKKILSHFGMAADKAVKINFQPHA